MTGTVSSAKRPASIAATAFSWLWSAKRSWRTRGISRSSARFSAVMPSGSVWPRRSISGLVKRQPSVVSHAVWCPGRVDLASASGARLIDSTPPPTNTSASPSITARTAWATASRPEPHRRFTVAPATSSG